MAADVVAAPEHGDAQCVSAVDFYIGVGEWCVETELEQTVRVLEAAARFAFAELAVNKIVWERWDAELLHVDGPLVKGGQQIAGSFVNHLAIVGQSVFGNAVENRPEFLSGIACHQFYYVGHFLSGLFKWLFSEFFRQDFSEVSLIPVFNKVSQNFSENACNFYGQPVGKWPIFYSQGVKMVLFGGFVVEL